jgi:hypothetical protein|tara:strand:- start:644 stop:745 length:102 start_codon:yes stop_codon:yes gene_type:complete
VEAVEVETKVVAVELVVTVLLVLDQVHFEEIDF